jgi:hypothetical protein
MQQSGLRHACRAASPLHPQVATSTPCSRLKPGHLSLLPSMPPVLQLHTRCSRHIVHNGKGFASSSTKPVGAAPAAGAATLTVASASQPHTYPRMHAGGLSISHQQQHIFSRPRCSDNSPGSSTGEHLAAVTLPPPPPPPPPPPRWRASWQNTMTAAAAAATAGVGINSSSLTAPQLVAQAPGPSATAAAAAAVYISQQCKDAASLMNPALDSASGQQSKPAAGAGLHQHEQHTWCCSSSCPAVSPCAFPHTSSPTSPSQH